MRVAKKSSLRTKATKFYMNSKPLLTLARADFHRALLRGVFTLDQNGIPTIADPDSDTSIAIARAMLRRVGETTVRTGVSIQISNKEFQTAVCDFLSSTFLKLDHLRPGGWEVRDRRSSESVEISNFEQYEHLTKLMEIIEADAAVAAALGSDYIITPDVVVLRRPEPEDKLNNTLNVADEACARLTPLRKINRPDNRTTVKGKVVEHTTLLLHASVSCKWTLRSDRAQNARSEALNLIRNRKGRVPHIVAITPEPLPSRIASLALGTSDLDCVYHVALPELQAAVEDLAKAGRGDQKKDLATLVNGKRLRDISDLPLDLAI
ncbi:MAG: NgoMIV family type II restriction endonuclease [Verrucomicrobiota bacterium]